MIKTTFLTLSLIFLTWGVGYAQGVVGGAFNQYMSDAPANTSIGEASPILRNAITDSPIVLNIRGFPVVGPVALIFGVASNSGLVIDINATTLFGMQIDVADRGAPGYGDQTLFNGFASLTSKTITSATGEFSRTTMMPTCFPSGASVGNCLPLPGFGEFEIGSQAVVTDPSNGPFNVSSTPAILGKFVSGYQEFALSGDLSGTFTFKQGFQFQYYGLNFTQAHISSNGFVSFGQVDNSFPSPTVANVRLGVRRIMSFYNDLVPEAVAPGGGPAYANTRIYAQQFKDANGLTKVKFVHDHLAEFSNQTGPHGGEIVITDNDDIAIYVPGYNGNPSINTVVGITPGNGVDPVVAGTGKDLSARFGTLWSPAALGKSIFELFDHGPGVITNPIDVVG
ncbi:MAG: hypothetical protein ACI97A_002562, partial [Planctomycetota bacterium]